MEIKIDKEKAMEAMQKGINPKDDPQAFMKYLNSETGRINEEAETIEKEDKAYELSSLGSPYFVGPLEISVTLGNLVLLKEIESPLLGLGNGDEISFSDACKAIYVLALGKEAVKPIMEINQRISDLQLLKGVVSEDKIIEKAEQISNARIKFKEDAEEFFLEYYELNDFEVIINSVIGALNDSLKAFESLDLEDKEKKTTNKKKV